MNKEIEKICPDKYAGNFMIMRFNRMVINEKEMK